MTRCSSLGSEFSGFALHVLFRGWKKCGGSSPGPHLVAAALKMNGSVRLAEILGFDK